jgi:hypothetical protein
VLDCCEHGNEHSGATKGGAFLDFLSELLAPQGEGLYFTGLVNFISLSGLFANSPKASLISPSLKSVCSLISETLQQ